jgi:hypothetical protein
MALLVSNSKFKNTTVEAPEMYVRLQYLALANGKNTSIILNTYLNKEAYKSNLTVDTNIPSQLLLVLEENQTQDLAVIHEIVKTELENLGFTVIIDIA